MLCSKSNLLTEAPSDAYCFELLSMVLALSGSNIGRQHIAQQHNLLLDLLGLLHTGSARVQRQVTSLFKRILPEITPQILAKILSITSLPPSDHLLENSCEIEFDIKKTGLLDVFLACIAKALSIQIKIKGFNYNNGNKNLHSITLATAIHPKDNYGNRWYLRGCMTRKLAEIIIQLLKEMSSGKMGEVWSQVTKNAISENILNLTKLNKNLRCPSECTKTPTLWLALASLCVIDLKQAERLSSSKMVSLSKGDQENGNQPQQPTKVIII